MAKILFINPPSRESIYLSTNTGVAAPSYPSLTLATLAAHVVKTHETRVIDLDLFRDPYASALDEIRRFRPDIVALTANTPAYTFVITVSEKIKKAHPGITVIVGGVHVTALLDEARAERSFDIVVRGEGDTVIPELVGTADRSQVRGIAFRDTVTGKASVTAERPPLQDLNSLPYPAWHLFTLDRYRNSRISSRNNPVGLIETSRGCAYQCVYCNKLTFGSAYRAKEPRRVVDEMAYMLACGFREIHIVDDSFTQDIGRAKDVCREMLRRRLKVPWSLINGIRVDKTDDEFFRLAKDAGCWQIGFGLETGDAEVLKNIGKAVTLERAEEAVRLAHRAGIDTFGFFILGLPGETEASMRNTVEFARKLPLDIAKFDICIPYPGTPYYRDLKASGRITTEDWSQYSCHNIDMPLYTHPNLAWPVIVACYKKSFRRFYLRPAYFLRRFMRSLKRGDLLYDLRYFFQAGW